MTGFWPITHMWDTAPTVRHDICERSHWTVEPVRQECWNVRLILHHAHMYTVNEFMYIVKDRRPDVSWPGLSSECLGVLNTSMLPGVSSSNIMPSSSCMISLSYIAHLIP